MKVFDLRPFMQGSCWPHPHLWIVEENAMMDFSVAKRNEKQRRRRGSPTGTSCKHVAHFLFTFPESSTEERGNAQPCQHWRPSNSSIKNWKIPNHKRVNNCEFCDELECFKRGQERSRISTVRYIMRDGDFPSPQVGCTFRNPTLGLQEWSFNPELFLGFFWSCWIFCWEVLKGPFPQIGFTFRIL